MAQPAVIPVKTGQKVPSVFGQWKAVITLWIIKRKGTHKNYYCPVCMKMNLILR